MPTLPRRRPRNPVALSPLLRKGGVHERSKTGVRAEAKQELQDELEFWQEENVYQLQFVPGVIPGTLIVQLIFISLTSDSHPLLIASYTGFVVGLYFLTHHRQTNAFPRLAAPAAVPDGLGRS